MKVMKKKKNKKTIIPMIVQIMLLVIELTRINQRSIDQKFILFKNVLSCSQLKKHLNKVMNGIAMYVKSMF
jgi:hypothetical protein